MTGQIKAAGAILAICVICISDPASAAGSLYGAGSLGFGGTGIGYALSGTFKNQILTVSVRYFGIYAPAEVEWDGIFSHGTPPAETASDIALLIGISSRYTKGVSATLEIGIGYAEVVSAGKHYFKWTPDSEVYDWNYVKQLDWTYGLALQSQFYMGRLGLTLMGNFNRHRSFGACMFSIRFGGPCN
jgi:hypothetical protein